MRVEGKSTGVTLDLHPADVAGRGAEGTVYRKGDVCVKVLAHAMDEKAAEAIEVISRLGRTIPGFAWPTELVVNPRTGENVGFTLPYVPGETLEHHLDNRLTAGWPASTKINIALSIARAVHHAHALTGPVLVLGDTLKPGNVQVDGDAATFIDTGSLSVFGYRTIDGSLTDSVSELSSPGYTAPEVLLTPALRPSHTSDRFALAVTLFEAIYGRHPAEPKPVPAAVGLDLDDSVKDGLFLRWVTHPDFEPPTYDPVDVPPSVESLFVGAFLGRPDQRPPAEAWVEALERWQQSLVPPKRPWRVWLPQFRYVDAALTAAAVMAGTALLARWAVADGLGVVRRLTSPAQDTEPLPTREVGPPLYREVFK